MKLVDRDAERHVLASILVRAGAFSEIAELIGPDAFGLDRHRAIADAVWAMARRRDSDLDFLSIQRELRAQGTVQLVGNTLAEILDVFPGPHLKHARRLRDLGVARRLHGLCRDIVDEAEQAEYDPLTWTDDVARRVTAAADVRRDLELVHVSELIDEHQRTIDRRGEGVEVGNLTGIDRFDAMTGGLHVCEYTVLAARPSCGKSALALQWGTAIAAHEPVALFSSEMKRIPVMDRFVAEAGTIDMRHLREGRLDAEERLGLANAYDMMRRSGAWMTDRRGWRATEIVAQLRTWLRKVRRPRHDGTIPKPTVIIDYLQRIKAPSRHHSREQEVAEISDIFATAAGELEVALVVLAQLTREAEKRPPEVPPQLADLRESGAIEQDADNIHFVHRPDRIDPLIERGAAMLSIAKQRNGECAILPLWFVGKHQRFIHRDRDYTRRGDDTPAPRRRKPSPPTHETKTDA
jgi:replicative DNA helicase